MTDQEFSQWVRRVWITFPDIYEWLHANSPDPIATQEVWRNVLRPYKLEEALMVLSDMAEGKRPAPKAYERSAFALMVKASIQFDRDEQAKRNKMLSIGDEYRKTSREQYRPLEADVPELRAAYAEFRLWDAETKLPMNDPVRMAKIKEISAKLFPQEAR